MLIFRKRLGGGGVRLRWLAWHYAGGQQFQGGVVECLYSHAYAVEGEGTQHGHIFFRQVVGIGLEGNFFGMFCSIHLFDSPEYLLEIFVGEL